jgi:hypothetical protein
LKEVKQVLEKIQFTKAQHKGQTQQQQKMQEHDMQAQNEEEIVQITTVASGNFNIIKYMLHIDNDMA